MQQQPPPPTRHRRHHHYNGTAGSSKIRFSYLITTIFVIIFTIRIVVIPSSSSNRYGTTTVKKKKNHGTLLSSSSSSSSDDDDYQPQPPPPPQQQHRPPHVGYVGPKIQYAKMNGLLQRNKGYADRATWDIIENPNCMTSSTSSTTSTTTTPATNNNNWKTKLGISVSSSSHIKDSASLTINSSPTLIRNHWLPEAILLGVQKGGTTALYQYIDKHPDIARTGKELYFLDEKIDQMMILQQKQQQQQQTQTQQQQQDAGIPQYVARQEYSQIMHQSMKYPTMDEGKMILDMTPNYLFYSDRLPARIKCVLPWAKLMVILRNPIDRARSQYDMKLSLQRGNVNSYGNPIPSFQQYIHNDLEALRETGVIQDWSLVDFDTYFDSPDMQKAWRAYINSGMNAPIGMGLYALQIKPYLDLLLPNNNNDDFLAIQSEKLAAETDETYGQVLDFLGLPRIKLGGTVPKVNTANKQRKTIIDTKTQKLLQDVFEPFNRKLGELLGSEWDGVWDYT